MRSRLQELYAADPQRVLVELRQQAKTNDWFLYVEQELAKPRSTFFATLSQHRPLDLHPDRRVAPANGGKATYSCLN